MAVRQLTGKAAARAESASAIVSLPAVRLTAATVPSTLTSQRLDVAAPASRTPSSKTVGSRRTHAYGRKPGNRPMLIMLDLPKRPAAVARQQVVLSSHTRPPPVEWTQRRSPMRLKRCACRYQQAD